MVKIIDMIIPKGKKARSGIRMTPTWITIHETDNTNVRANALAHARLQYNGNNRLASWHFQVDDEPEIYRSLPENEVGWAAGDGNGPGNRSSIHIEICVNRDGNYAKAVRNAAELTKYLLNKHPTIKGVNYIAQHNKWSGKNCPRNLRSGAKGISWTQFLNMVKEGSSSVTKPATPPPYETTNNNFNIGDKVQIKKSATHYATGQAIGSQYKGKTYTIQQRGSNRMLIKEIYSWVKNSDLEKVGSTPSSPKPQAPSKPSQSQSIKVGSNVTLSKNATHYATGQTIPAHIKGKVFTVQQVKTDRVLLKEIVSWVKIGDVTTGSASTPKPATPNFNVGSTVKIKTTAKTYATGQSIASFAKGKSYKIMQTKSDRVLLDKIMSWVRKTDLE